MHVLTAGGAGFLGSPPRDKLISRGNSVACVDNFPAGRICNVEHLPIKDGFRFVENKIWVDVNMASPVDVVAHLGSSAAPLDYHCLPLKMPVGQSQNGEFIATCSTKRCSFHSRVNKRSLWNPTLHSRQENYYGNVKKILPRSVHGEAKKFSEAPTFAYRRTLNVNVGVMRIFNVYGPWMRPDGGRAVTAFMAQTLGGAPLAIYGDGRKLEVFATWMIRFMDWRS